MPHELSGLRPRPELRELAERFGALPWAGPTVAELSRSGIKALVAAGLSLSEAALRDRAVPRRW